jgi:hypothetical protein
VVGGRCVCEDLSLRPVSAAVTEAMTLSSDTVRRRQRDRGQSERPRAERPSSAMSPPPLPCIRPITPCPDLQAACPLLPIRTHNSGHILCIEHRGHAPHACSHRLVHSTTHALLPPFIHHPHTWSHLTLDCSTAEHLTTSGFFHSSFCLPPPLIRPPYHGTSSSLASHHHLLPYHVPPSFRTPDRVDSSMSC